MEEALITFLLASPQLAALVGNRITWATRPQASALPAVVLHKVAGQPEYSDEGEAGLFFARIQIDCWAQDIDSVSSGYSNAKQVARAVIDQLSGAAFTQGGIEFQGSFIEDEQDSFEEGAGGEKLNRVRLDFTIWHT